MAGVLIFGNWKSNKNVYDSQLWLDNFALQVKKSDFASKNVTCCICAPYTNLYILRKTIDRLTVPMLLGAQDISPFPDGAYTGQISAGMLKDLADWVIIGHSERRKYFKETDEQLVQKTKNAKKEGLKVLYCVSDPEMSIPDTVDAIGYEPVWAIGTGKADTPENANNTISKIKEKSSVHTVLYGGSVNDSNVKDFVSQEYINGVLVGGASLEPESFFQLIQNTI